METISRLHQMELQFFQADNGRYRGWALQQLKS